MNLSNPRKEAIVENWPHGKQRVTAHFTSETNKRGTRILRTTTGKPKATTYYCRAAIVDNDGKTAIIAESEYGQRVLIGGTLKYTDYFNQTEHPETYKLIGELLDQVGKVAA